MEVSLLDHDPATDLVVGHLLDQLVCCGYGELEDGGDVGDGVIKFAVH